MHFPINFSIFPKKNHGPPCTPSMMRLKTLFRPLLEHQDRGISQECRRRSTERCSECPCRVFSDWGEEEKSMKGVTVQSRWSDVGLEVRFVNIGKSQSTKNRNLMRLIRLRWSRERNSYCFSKMFTLLQQQEVPTTSLPRNLPCLVFESKNTFLTYTWQRQSGQQTLLLFVRINTSCIFGCHSTLSIPLLYTQSYQKSQYVLEKYEQGEQTRE